MTAVTALQRDLHAALPPLTVHARAILDALLLTGGSIGSASVVATRLGLPSRFALGRMLARQGLPGLRELAAWISLLEWIILAERFKVPLFVIATRSRRSPAVCYRTVKRLTGLTWAELRAHGSPWVLRLFAAQCRGATAPTARRPAVAAAGRPLRPVAVLLASPPRVSSSSGSTGR